MKNTMKLITVFFLLIIICNYQMQADDAVFVNPGFKFSYTFGEKGGFTFGAEISITKWVEGHMYGIVASVDHCKNSNRLKYHIGAEYLYCQIGPTLTVENGKTDYGIGFTPYYGVFIIPYYNFTWRFNNDNLQELGTFLKFHIPARGKGFSVG